MSQCKDCKYYDYGFFWNGEDEDNFDICKKGIKTEQLFGFDKACATGFERREE